MWRNWNPLNPPVNHQSSEDEQNNYESADDDLNQLVSPNRPHQSPSASPRALLRPDPPTVDEVLQGVNQQLRVLPSREERVANRNAVRAAQEAAEAAAAVAQAASMPDVDQVDFEVENGQDDAKALEFTRTLKMEFAKDDIAFWFIQIENEMFSCGVRSQWMKRCVLVRNLPPAIQSDVKSLLTLKQSAAPADIYKKIKDEILRIHVPD